MNKTNDYKFNLPTYSDPVDIEDLNDNFRGIDDALMAGLCKKDYTGNNMGSSDPSARKYAWAPWFEIVNDNEFDVVVTDRNAPVESEEATINIAAGRTVRKYINGRYYMNFYVQDQHDVTFKWFTNAETYINESGGGGGGTGTVTSVSVQGGSGSHLTGSGNPIETSGTITINVDDGYSIPSDNEQTAWDGKAADLKAEIDSSTYVLTLQLKDSAGNLIGTAKTIDLPLETMVVDGEYDSQTKKIKLELKNGNYVEFSVADLVSGLQTELSASNKLGPDYIDYDASHRAVSDTEKDTWNGKQNALTFDDTPTQNSNNPVKSGGIYTALTGKQASLDSAQLAAVNSGIDSAKVAQISTNQTNILYVLGKTGKNLLDCSLDRLKAVNNEGTWNGNVYTVASVGTVTINSDNTITVVKTGTSARLVFYLSSNQEAAAISGDKFAGYILSGCPSGGSSTTYRLTGEEISSPWSTVANDFGSGDTIQSSTLLVGFYISIHADYTTTGSGLTFSPMICTEADWNISKNYVPYALPNYDLTQLEQQDRNALVEVVDEGAKNLFNYSAWVGCTVSNGTGVFENNGVTLTATSNTVCHTNFLNGVYPEYAKVFVNNGDKITLSWDYEYQSETGGSVHIYANGAVNQYEAYAPITAKQIDYTVPTGVTFLTFCVLIGENNQGKTVKFKDLMFCTKAKHDISPNYAPYRKNLDQLEATKAPALVLGSGVSSGSLDDVTKPTFDLYLDTVSNLPTLANYYVETSVWDSQSMIQRAYNVGNAESYIRVKSMNTWSAWKQITNA